MHKNDTHIRKKEVNALIKSLEDETMESFESFKQMN